MTFSDEVLRIIPTGQWSAPMTSGIMNALVIDLSRFSVTKKFEENVPPRLTMVDIH